MWKNILGVNVTQANNEWKVFLQNRTKGQYQIGRMGATATADDITNFTDTYRCGDVANSVGYCSKEFDDLMAKSAEIADDHTRQALQRQAIIKFDNDYPIIPIYQYTYYRAVKPYVKGYDTTHNYFDQVKSKWLSLE